jgi:hypothetical protein
MQPNEHTEYTVIRARGSVFVIRFGEQGVTVDELSDDMSELLDTPIHATWEAMGVLPEDNEEEDHG